MISPTTLPQSSTNIDDIDDLKEKKERKKRERGESSNNNKIRPMYKKKKRKKKSRGDESHERDTIHQSDSVKIIEESSKKGREKDVNAQKRSD